MNVGPILVEDGEMDAIRKCYAQSSFEGEVPDFQGDPLYPIQLSVRHEGKFLAAAIVKVEAQVTITVNREATKPRDRFNAVSVINDALIMSARRHGFDQLVALLEPRIATRFGQRMVESWGWWRDVDRPRYLRRL